MTVQVADGNGGFDTQAIAVTVTNTNEAPVITSNGGGASAVINVAENTTAVTTVTAVDADAPAQALTYAIVGGADAGAFTIDAASGNLALRAAPDFEAAADADADNVYQVAIGVSDGQGGVSTQMLNVAVLGVNEAPGAITPVVASVAEGATAGTLVAVVSAFDPDAGEVLRFSLVSDGGGRFVVDATSGVLTVAPGAALDFEAQTSHTLVLRVTDAQGLTSEQAIVVSLQDVAEGGGGTPTPSPTPAPLPTPTPEPAPPVNTQQPPATDSPSSPAPTTASASAVAAVLVDQPNPARGAGSGELAQGVVDDDRSGTRADGYSVLMPTLRLPRDAAPTFASVTFMNDGVDLGDVWSLSPDADADITAHRVLVSSLRVGADEGDDARAGDGGSRRSADDVLRSLLQDPVRVASATLTAGFVWWLTRGGGLLTSMLMGVPAWRHVDLLPVLGPARDGRDDDDAGDGDVDAADLPFRLDVADDARLGDDPEQAVASLFNASRMFGESKIVP